MSLAQAHPLHRFDNEHCCMCNSTDLNQFKYSYTCNNCGGWALHEFTEELNEIKDMAEEELWRKILEL